MGLIFISKPQLKMNFAAPSLAILWVIFCVFNSSAFAQTQIKKKSLSKNSKSFLIAQEDLFDQLDSDEGLSGEDFLSEEPEGDTSLIQNNTNDSLESFLGEDANLEADPMLEGELIEETVVEEPVQQPIPREATDDLQNENAMANDIRSMQGPNKKASNKRVKFIKHPNQKHGLYKISSDGRYYYKVEESKQKYGLGIKGGAVIYNQLENTIDGTTVKFNDIYGASEKTALYVEYYWSYFKDKNVPRLLKKARVKLGSGLLYATGTGRFTRPEYQGVVAKESYTFLAFPNHIGLHLGLDLKDKQLIIPYVTGALEYLVAIEASEGFSRTRFMGQLGAHFGGGLALSLGWLDDAAKINLDSEFGINETYLTVELRQNVALQQDFNFTATYVNVGLQLEF